MRIIRLDEVLNKTSLSRSTIYKYISEDVFPKSIPLGYRSVGWLESEINDWILTRIERRDGPESGAIGLPRWPAE